MTLQFPTSQFLDMIDAEASSETNGGAVTRHFDLPPILHGLTVVAYLAFLCVMAIGFQSREMILPMVISAIYIILLFGLCALWATMKPAHQDRPEGLGHFFDRGLNCATGHLTAKEAMVQIFILPVLILFWGVSVAVIAQFY